MKFNKIIALGFILGYFVLGSFFKLFIYWEIPRQSPIEYLFNAIIGLSIGIIFGYIGGDN